MVLQMPSLLSLFLSGIFNPQSGLAKHTLTLVTTGASDPWNRTSYGEPGLGAMELMASLKSDDDQGFIFGSASPFTRAVGSFEMSLKQRKWSLFRYGSDWGCPVIGWEPILSNLTKALPRNLNSSVLPNITELTFGRGGYLRRQTVAFYILFLIHQVLLMESTPYGPNTYLACEESIPPCSKNARINVFEPGSQTKGYHGGRTLYQFPLGVDNITQVMARVFAEDVGSLQRPDCRKLILPMVEYYKRILQKIKRSYNATDPSGGVSSEEKVDIMVAAEKLFSYSGEVFPVTTTATTTATTAPAPSTTREYNPNFVTLREKLTWEAFLFGLLALQIVSAYYTANNAFLRPIKNRAQVLDVQSMGKIPSSVLSIAAMAHYPFAAVLFADSNRLPLDVKIGLMYPAVMLAFLQLVILIYVKNKRGPIWTSEDLVLREPASGSVSMEACQVSLPNS